VEKGKKNKNKGTTLAKGGTQEDGWRKNRPRKTKKPGGKPTRWDKPLAVGAPFMKKEKTPVPILAKRCSDEKKRLANLGWTPIKNEKVHRGGGNRG